MKGAILHAGTARHKINANGLSSTFEVMSSV